MHGCFFARVVCINAKLCILHGSKHVLQTIKMVIFYNEIILSYSNNSIILYEKHSPPMRPKLFYCRLEVTTVDAAEPATRPERRFDAISVTLLSLR